MIGKGRIVATLVAIVIAVPTCISLVASAHAKSDMILHAFKGSSDGHYPLAGLIADNKGNLYGTTQEGGGLGCGRYGCGAVFQLMPDGAEAVLHAFAGGTDGVFPFAALVADKAGNLYGTTRLGGSSHHCRQHALRLRGCGAVFELAPDGTETVLYSFNGGSDGGYPVAGLIRDEAGNLYGTSEIGGKGCGGVGCGTVFKVFPDGTETVLHAFDDRGNDGVNPVGRLVRLIADKHLYGTTEYGCGSTGCGGCSYSGCGTIFKLSPDGTEQVLYTFAGGTDGAVPSAGLIGDDAGNLYGTTAAGGDTACARGYGCGTVFKLAADGTETVLYAFAGGNDGASPVAELVIDENGDLYGTTGAGGGTGCGGTGCGTVFKLASDGTEEVLHAFQGGTDGAAPRAGLIDDDAGNLLGTTYQGGGNGCGGSGCGTVFQLRK